MKAEVRYPKHTFVYIQYTHTHTHTWRGKSAALIPHTCSMLQHIYTHDSFLNSSMCVDSLPVMCNLSFLSRAIRPLTQIKWPLILAFSQVHTYICHFWHPLILVMCLSHAYSIFLLASIYLAKYLCTKFPKISGPRVCTYKSNFHCLLFDVNLYRLFTNCAFRYGLSFSIHSQIRLNFYTYKL